MIAIGLDGFRHGWVAVTLNGDRREIAFASDITWLAGQRFVRAAIDIPIGLPDGGVRACDLAARARLRPHASRVFTGASRLLLAHDSHAAANETLSRRGDAKISIQLWGVMKKIREVDDFVRAHPAWEIRETHPELVFQRLNGGRPLDSKHTADGLAQRCTLLREAGFSELDIWLTKTRIGHGAKADDVLDACAAALVARAPAGCVPDGAPPRDSLDLPMQIWF